MTSEKFKKRLFRIFPKSGFARGVSILAGGTVISQLIAIFTLPLLTRLYSPEDFSILAVYSSLLALVTVVSCLRFEIAIPIPKENKKAKDLLALSLISVFFVNVVFSMLLIMFSNEIHSITQGRLIGYLWIIPLGGVLTGAYAAYQYWATREKNYNLISETKITQAVSGSSTQIGLGYLGLTPLGLLIGQVINMGGGVWRLAHHYYKNNPPLRKEIVRGEIKDTFREYEKYPKLSTLEALTNSAASQVPLLLIATYAAGPEVGFLMLSIRLLSAPMALLGRAVGQVYLSEAPYYHQNGKLNQYTRKTILVLTKLGFFPLLVAGVASPFLVPVIFGEEWSRAGVLIAWMVPWFFMQFISSPVSISLHMVAKHKAALILQCFGFLFRSGIVLYAGLYLNNLVVEIYAITGFLFYSIYMAVIFSVLKLSEVKCD
ncbi:lipopolysaccharide biosynthesis protein [Billgrantia aerodenitrificans]|uniref:Oligosaccharide flippase family protein n=1 Tax=Billgrantia aerodenitrificans TaxID=2733483 RepID=A0ABS9AVC4_9GAMM|nr:oligosaccharide flippase family protein [Halomonas aerodenitrificans]MCE8025744.1 oligosaccharide flippase family protein [Halomonas aerodenitrificans]